MTKKKLGRILFVSTLPHLAVWAILGISLFGLHELVPDWMIWWLAAIICILIASVFWAIGTTLKGFWKAIIEFINE